MKIDQVISGIKSGIEQQWTGETAAARRNKRRLKKGWKFIFGIGRFVFLFSLCLVLLYPVLIMLSIAFREGRELYDPSVVWLPKHFTFEHFQTILTELNLLPAVGSTALISVVGTIFQLISCMLAGYGFARFKFPGKKLLFGVLLLTIIVPPQVVTIPSMMDFQRFDFFGIGQIVGLFTGEALTISLRDSLWAYFLPALVGFLAGILFLLFIDSAIPHLHVGSTKPEGRKSGLGRTAMMMLAVTIHNFPEGAACGAIFAGVLNGDSGVTMAAAITLSIGIAIQNFPEGAIISLPLRSEGHSRLKSFALGALSGIVEPIGALIAIALAGMVTPALPYMLAFAAGAMLYVVVEELIPEASEGEHSNLGTISFAVGFALMMVLDVALG